MMNFTSSDLFLELQDLINQIPKGKVTTFKQLALALGSEYALKFVVENLNKVKGPWWRVVNEKGEIKNFFQKLKLQEEGIEIEGNKIKNFDKYLFKDFVSNKPLEKLREIQKELTKKIKLEDEFEKIEIIGGVDLSYKNNKAKVVFVLLDKNLNLIKYFVFEKEVNFPYIPTFLAFREGPPIVESFKEIEPKPDILFVNGQGIAHPVKLGLASYVGVLLDIPTIGVTKTHLYGKIIENKIFDENGNLIGFVLEKFGNKVYVSPGHKVSVFTAKELAEKFWIKGRYPEPVRLADEISKKVK